MGRRLGQHFIFDRGLLDRIVDAAGVRPGDNVLEIGPGPGTLTHALLERGARVVAVELDPRLYGSLVERFSGREGLTLHLADALRFDYSSLGVFKVVANIPYEITTPLIFRLLEQVGRIEGMTLTVQKEVALRIVAPPGGKDYGVLTLMVRRMADAQLEFIIPRGCFSPPPRVDSACIRIGILPEPRIPADLDEGFSRVVRASFSQRRKTIKNALKGLSADPGLVLERAGIYPGLRPERLSLEDFARLARALALGLEPISKSLPAARGRPQVMRRRNRF